MAKISDLNNRLTKLPQPQSPAKAGFMQTIAGTGGTPSGWLLCNGSVVNQADYPDLYARIGTTFNTGSEGVGTFRLPNGGPDIKTNWTAWIPEFDNDTGTPNWHYVYWRRNGQNLEIYGKVTFSANSYDYAFSGPKIEGNLQATFVNIEQEAVVGYANLQDTSSTDRRLQPVVYLNNAVTGNVDGFRIRNPNTINASIYTFQASVPIDIWQNDAQHIIKAYDDSIDAYTVGITDATPSSAGTIKKNLWIKKQDTSTYTTFDTDLIPLTSIPQGTYRVTVGARYIGTSDNSAAKIIPKLDGNDITDVDGQWIVGADSSGTVTNENMGGAYTSTLILDFPNPTQTFHLDIAISGGLVVDPFYILEKLENYEKITTEWD